MPHRLAAAREARAQRSAEPSAAFAIRRATPDDLDALEALENAAFESDRLSRRSLRRAILAPTNALLVATSEARLAGYALLAFRAGTALARLYSVAVHPDFTGQGLGRALMDACEDAALEHNSLFLRLEVRADNPAAIRLYENLGYRRFDVIEDYYEDGETAHRYEKLLVADVAEEAGSAPFYRQTTEFTCGPACLLMALGWADTKFQPTRALEITLWREATCVFMTSGIGGCEPYGLAVALAKRGLRPELRLSRPGPFFLDTVRSDEKREVMRLTQEEFRADAERLGVTVGPALDRATLEREIRGGAVAIVLVSGYRMFREKFPHWVLAHGVDGGFVLVNDPYVDAERGESEVAARNLPIPLDEFGRMARFGRDDLRAAILLRPKARGVPRRRSAGSGERAAPASTKRSRSRNLAD